MGVGHAAPADSGDTKGDHDLGRYYVSFLLAMALLLALVGCGSSSASVRPFVGGPYSDFVTKYGQPIRTGADGRAVFRASSSPDVLVSVSPTSGAVTLLGAAGPTSWTDQDTLTFCAQFLPKEATEYRSVGKNKYYHSKVGDLHLDVPGTGVGTSGTGAGTCGVTLSHVAAVHVV
jgi:hypothetical protein